MKRKKFDVRYGRADAAGIGIALVFTEGLVAALGPWYIEVDW